MLHRFLWMATLLLTQQAYAQGITWVQYIVNQKKESHLPAYLVTIHSNGQVTYQGIQQAVFNGFINGKLMAGEWQKLESQLKPLSSMTYTADKGVMEEYGQRHLLWQTAQGLKKRVNIAPNYPKEEKLIDYIQKIISNKVTWDRTSFIPHPNEIPSANIPFEPGTTVYDPPAEPGDRLVEQDILFPEIPVQFPGGDIALKNYIDKNIVIPNFLKEQNQIVRAVYEIKFAVDGRIMDVKLLRSSGNNEADMEGVKLIRRMPNWIPAKNNGRPVPGKYTLPITFKPE